MKRTLVATPIFVLGLVLAAGLALACSRAGKVGVVEPDQLASVLQKPDAPLLLDVRTDQEWDAGHVPGAEHIPLQALPERLAGLAPYKERGVITYCETGGRASKAAALLEEHGFKNVSLLDGSMRRWRSEGRPIAKPEE